MIDGLGPVNRVATDKDSRVQMPGINSAGTGGGTPRMGNTTAIVMRGITYAIDSGRF